MGPPKPGLPSEQPQPSSQAQRARLSCAQDPEEEAQTTLASSPLRSYAPGSEEGGRGNCSARQRRQVSANGISLCILPAQAPQADRLGAWASMSAFLFLAWGNRISSSGRSKQLHPQRQGRPVPALPGCQRPWQSQLTPSHPPRNTRWVRDICGLTCCSGKPVCCSPWGQQKSRTQLGD